MTEKIAIPSEYFDKNDSDNTCFSCNNPRFSVRQHVTHYDFPFTFQQCECGLVKQTPMPNEQFFEWFFNSDVFFSARDTNKNHIWGYYDYFADEPNRMATSQWRYKKLKHLFDGGKKHIMKIGPATGTFLYTAKQHGHDVLGCDISAEFRQYAIDNYGVSIDHGRFEKQPYADEQFDTVFLLNVIENVPNQVEFLNAIHRTIRPGGYFVLNYVEMENNWIERLQRSKYFLYRPPVCYAYTGDVLKRILDNFGFDVVEKHHDVRTLNIEKISTLLGWHWAARLARFLHINRLPVRLWAYPSFIVVAQRRPNA